MATQSQEMINKCSVSVALLSEVALFWGFNERCLLHAHGMQLLSQS